MNDKERAGGEENPDAIAPEPIYCLRSHSSQDNGVMVF